MNDKQRGCALVFKQGLEMKGWQALDECTLVKNYCVFKMYDNDSPEHVGFVLPGYSWTLTREGVPLCAGRISSTVANLQLNSADKDDVDSVLTSIKDLERYASMPRYLQFANRMQRTKSASVVTSLQPVKVASNVRTNLIIVNESIDSCFKVGCVYEVAGWDKQGVYLFRYSMKTNTQDGRGFVYKDMLRWKKAIESGKFSPVVLQDVSESKNVFTYANVSISDCNVPEGLLSKTKSDYVKSAIVQLYNANRNFTPLLTANYDYNCVDDIAQFFMNQDVSMDFTGRFLCERSLAMLDKFGAVGFDANFIMDNYDDEERMQSVINYIVGLSEAPYNINRDCIRALYPLAGKFDPTKLPETSSAEILYLKLKYEKSLPTLVHSFETLGMVSDAGVEIMPAHMTSAFYDELRKVFSIPYEFDNDAVNWSTVLDNILNHVTSVRFSIKDGFRVGFYHYQLGRDYNSVFIIDKNNTCWWRGTCIDEKVYCDYNTLLQLSIL